MIPRVQIDPRKDIHIYSMATTHPFFEENLLVLEDLLLRSLLVDRGAYSSLQMQADLLENILLTDRARRMYQRNKDRYRRALNALAKQGASVDRLKQAQLGLEDNEQGLIASKWFGERLRVIGDGVAWRLLDYDRADLRLLAEHPPVSVPQLDIGLKSEIQELLRIATNEEQPAVLNAVTNFLRIGDITVKHQGSKRVELIEVKTTSSSDPRTVRQTEYRMQIQESLNSGIHSIGGVRTGKILTEKPLRTYSQSVEQAMREAELKLGASRKFGSYLTVGVLNIKKISQGEPEENWAKIWGPILDRLYSVKERPTDVLLDQMDNFLAITHFSPNIAPYSVFPLEPRLRLAFMVGDFWVISLLNISGLARWLEKRGWRTEVFDPHQETSSEDELLNFTALRVGKKGLSVGIGLTELTIASLEFWMPESIEDSVETIMRSVPPNSSSGHGPYSQIVFPNTGRYAWD